MNHYDDLQRFQEKNADAKPQLSGSFFASRHAGTRRLGDPQSAKSRRRETLFSGAGRLGLRAVAAVGARGSVPPVEAAVAAAPTSDPVVSAASVAPATSQPVVETAAAAPDPVRQEPAPTPAPSIPASEPAMAPPPRMAPDPRPPLRTMPTCSPRKARSRWRKIKTSL